MAYVLSALLTLTPASAGNWKYEVVPNDGDVLTYSEDGN